MTLRTKSALCQGLKIVPEAHTYSLVFFFLYALWHHPLILLVALSVFLSPAALGVLTYVYDLPHVRVRAEDEFEEALATAFKQNVFTIIPSFLFLQFSKLSDWMSDEVQKLPQYQQHALCVAFKATPFCHAGCISFALVFFQTRSSWLFVLIILTLLAPLGIGIWSYLYMDHHSFRTQTVNDSVCEMVLMNVITWPLYVFFLMYSLFILTFLEFFQCMIPGQGQRRT